MGIREYQKWEVSQVKVRESAQRLAAALCDVAEDLFAKERIKKELTVLVEVMASTGAREPNKGTIPITITPPKSAQLKRRVDSSQDLFLTILSPLIDIFVAGEIVISERGGHPMLQNSTVTAASDILVKHGLAAPFDASSCAISLLADKLHSDPESLLSHIIDAARTYRLNAEWDRAQTIMMWACKWAYNHYSLVQADGSEPPIEGRHLFSKALRMTGELYRWSCIQRFNKDRRDFGFRGIK